MKLEDIIDNIDGKTVPEVKLYSKTTGNTAGTYPTKVPFLLHAVNRNTSYHDYKMIVPGVKGDVGVILDGSILKVYFNGVGAFVCTGGNSNCAYEIYTWGDAK